MTEATKGQKVIPLPTRADTGVLRGPGPQAGAHRDGDPDPRSGQPRPGPRQVVSFVDPCDEDSNVSVDPNGNDFPDDSEEDNGFLGDRDGAGQATLPESSMPGRREQQ